MIPMKCQILFYLKNKKKRKKDKMSSAAIMTRTIRDIYVKWGILKIQQKTWESHSN